MADLFLKQTAPQKNFTDQDKINWLRLFRTDNVGPVTFYRLLDRFGSAGEALNALPHLSKKGGKAKPLNAPPVSEIEKEIDALHKVGADFICAGQELYPLPLSAIEDAPPVLTYKGNLRLTRKNGLGIVGARNASLNGRKLTEKLACEIGREDIMIISGLARGIDTAAHTASLETGTIAVVAGGIDIIYPQENAALYEQICERGLIVAESPLGMEPLARHFPRRNRIISGLSCGVLVVEATLKSGSLITARMAAEQGRDVFAVPGHPFDPRAEGPNRLIKDGAVMVQNARDILENINAFTGSGLSDHNQFSWIMPPAEEQDIAGIFEDEQNMDELRNMLLSNLSETPCPVDELARTCQVSVSNVQAALLELELAGRLQRLPGGRVALINIK